MQISEEIIKVLEHICEKFGYVVDWAGNNIMPYFNELCNKIIKYEICTSIIEIAAFLMAIALCVIFIRKLICWAKEECELYIAAITLGAITLIFAVGFFIQIYDIVECSVFPEKYLFEYFTELLKGC